MLLYFYSCAVKFRLYNIKMFYRKIIKGYRKQIFFFLRIVILPGIKILIVIKKIAVVD